MRDEIFRFLLSPAGREALELLTPEEINPDNHLHLIDRLRLKFPVDESTAVLETALLRQRGIAKFGRAAQMYFTREGLEQATSEVVAAHRARRFTEASMAIVADLGCGIGGDTLALATTAEVMAIDRLWLHARMTKENAAVYGVEAKVIVCQADLEQLSPLKVHAFHFDPARRTSAGPRSAPTRRLYSPSDYQPPLSLIDIWRESVPHGSVKVSPAIQYHDIPGGAEVEFVSHEGQLKECILWFGGLRDGAERRATLLPTGHTLSAQDIAAELTLTAPLAYLYEPDSAIIRARLIPQLGYLLDAGQIDPTIAYLTAERPLESPFARCFRVEDYFPFQLKRLRSYCRAHNIGQVTIKKRGSPIEPDELRQALRLRGNEHRILILTQASGRPTVIVGEAWPGFTSAGVE